MTQRTYTKISAASWELARGAYLSGLSASVVARRFGVTVSALRKRAQRDGWTKAAQALTLDAGVVARPVPAISLDPRVLARTALVEAARAMVEGRPYAARAHAAAGEAMGRLCDRIPGYEDVDSVQEGQERQSNMDGMIESIAWELALKLHRGEPIPPGLWALEKKWREWAQAAELEARQAGQP